jgi:hypothetical protein
MNTDRDLDLQEVGKPKSGAVKLDSSGKDYAGEDARARGGWWWAV